MMRRGFNVPWTRNCHLPIGCAARYSQPVTASYLISLRAEVIERPVHLFHADVRALRQILQIIDALLESVGECVGTETCPARNAIEHVLPCMLKAIVIFIPHRERDRKNGVGVLWHGLRLDKVSSQPAAQRRGLRAYDPDMDNQAEASYGLGVQAQFMPEHVEHVADSIGVDTAGNAVALSREQQVASRHTSPHVDRKS